MTRFKEVLVIPDDFLKTISCSCKTSCENNKCGCGKHECYVQMHVQNVIVQTVVRTLTKFEKI